MTRKPRPTETTPRKVPTTDDTATPIWDELCRLHGNPLATVTAGKKAA